MNKVDQAKDIIKRVAAQTDRVMLFYSGGKDSIVLLDLMAPYFREVICVFMYFVPNLTHINRWLNWATTRYPNVKMVQIPHWNLTYVLRSGMYCVENPNVKVFKVGQVDENMRIKYGVNYTFYGMKKADGLHRRLMLNTYEGGISNTKKVYPLENWTNKEVLTYMRQNNIPKPVRYSNNASGGVGFNTACYVWMRNNEPEDLQKVLRVFPMSEKILFDFDEHKRREERLQGKRLTDEEALKNYKKQ